MASKSSGEWNRMRPSPLIFLLAAASHATLLSPTKLIYDRVHCVAHDAVSGNFLFRSNMPLAYNATGVALESDFGYEDLSEAVRDRAAEECGAAVPEEFFLLEVTLNNALDDTQGLVAVRAWHSTTENMGLGRLVEWPIGTAGIIPAARVPAQQRSTYAQNMWEVDQIPQRVQELNSLLAMKEPAWGGGKALVVAVHCSAGCDRTGEMIGAWRLEAYTSGWFESQMSAADMYALDVSECTRAPNYYSTHALEWYCLYLQDQGMQGLGDCLSFATCEPPPKNNCSQTGPAAQQQQRHMQRQRQ